MRGLVLRQLGRTGGWKRLLRRLHRDERGAEGLEKLLIILAIVLPLLAILIYFRNAISTWIKSAWEDTVGTYEDETDTGDFDVPS